jgi:predicted ABC-type ATPase
MLKPQLLVIAACNGSGKSSYSKILSPDGIDVFEYDKYYLKIHSGLIPTEFQDQMAHTMAFEKLVNQIELAIVLDQSFS